MDVFTYSYSCSNWYSQYQGVRNIYVEDGTLPEIAAKKDALVISGASRCDVQLIQRFKMVVTDVETYPAMACQPLHKWREPEAPKAKHH